MWPLIIGLGIYIFLSGSSLKNTMQETGPDGNPVPVPAANLIDTTVDQMKETFESDPVWYSGAFPGDPYSWQQKFYGYVDAETPKQSAGKPAAFIYMFNHWNPAENFEQSTKQQIQRIYDNYLLAIQQHVS